MSNIEIFQEEHPSLESYWRSVILFGRNVASYKFALAKSLLEIAPSGQSSITLEELAKPFSRNLCEHIKVAPKQATSNSSQFLEACKKYNDDLIKYDELIATTVKKGFVNVIDAFHIVNNGEIPVQFYTKDYSKTGKRIILTDKIFKLQEVVHSEDFMQEAESRWNLVETAWALNGYQKGKCFYCFGDISVDKENKLICDVDHFYPHTLQTLVPKVNLNGVWNLVLSCPECNRGANGKFAKVPQLKYLKRLHKRNEFLISSHHPLRETLISQTGRTEKDRVEFLQGMDHFAINTLIHRWDVEPKGEELF